ncbi:MAG TPA: hypothetical protein VGB73_00420, partial [Pyrinomonadaceae bacterium]
LMMTLPERRVLLLGTDLVNLSLWCKEKLSLKEKSTETRSIWFSKIDFNFTESVLSCFQIRFGCLIDDFFSSQGN